MGSQHREPWNKLDWARTSQISCYKASLSIFMTVCMYMYLLLNGALPNSKQETLAELLGASSLWSWSSQHSESQRSGCRPILECPWMPTPAHLVFAKLSQVPQTSPIWLLWFLLYPKEFYTCSPSPCFQAYSKSHVKPNLHHLKPQLEVTIISFPLPGTCLHSNLLPPWNLPWYN